MQPLTDQEHGEYHEFQGLVLIQTGQYTPADFDRQQFYHLL